MAGKPKEAAPIDIDAMVEERLSSSRDELRKIVIREVLRDILEDAAAENLSLEDFINALKNKSKELWKFASQLPVHDIAAEITGARYLADENRRLKEELRGGGRKRGRRVEQAGDGDQIKTKILGYLKNKNEKFTIGQIVKGIGADTAQVKRPLAELRRAGQIIAEGERRSMRYSLPN
jgi:hypothetical protein